MGSRGGYYRSMIKYTLSLCKQDVVIQQDMRCDAMRCDVRCDAMNVLCFLGLLGHVEKQS